MYVKKLIQASYENLRLSLLATVINASIFTFIFYNQTNKVTLFAWYFVHLLVSIVRYISYKKFKSSPHSLPLREWERIFTVGVISSAIVWGAMSFLFFLPDVYLYQMALIVIVAGMSAGAVSSLSQSLLNIWSFLFIILLPLLIELFLQPTAVHTNIFILVFLYLLLLLKVSKTFNQNYVDAIESHILYERKKEELLHSEQQFETIFKHAPIGIMLYDKNLIIQNVNEEFINFLHAPREFLIGLDLHKVPDQSVTPACQAAIDGMDGFYEGPYTTMYRQIGLHVSITSSPIKDKNDRIIGALAIITDITQRIHTQERLEHQANHDNLTNIPNRTMLIKEIQKEIVRFQRHNQLFGIIFMDLDHFKNINDSLGHSVGDKMLIITAQRIQSAIRIEDTVARIGGDEFVVLVPNLGSNTHAAVIKIEHVAQKIHEVLSVSYDIDTYALSISSSLGITLVTDDITDHEDLLKHADIAMYQAKKEGRNTTRFYQNEMDIWIKRRLEVENELRNAIYNNELQLHYQPIVNLQDSRIVGAEALLRWKSEKLGSVFPDEFIPIAEESGLIISIGEWVLENALKQFVAWQKEFPLNKELRKIAVNVSVHQFNSPNFLQQLQSVITQSGIDPKFVELELTESIIAKDINTVKQKMLRLRALGISLSIDDFGTGYSSLSYLQKLPFTTLKIDKSFTNEIAENMDEKELLSTILTIAENFHLEVVVEGVETYAQYLYIKVRGATFLQGYYCSRPMDNETFTTMLTTNNGTCTILDKF